MINQILKVENKPTETLKELLSEKEILTPVMSATETSNKAAGTHLINELAIAKPMINKNCLTPSKEEEVEKDTNESQSKTPERNLPFSTNRKDQVKDKSCDGCQKQFTTKGLNQHIKKCNLYKEKTK